MLTIFNRTLAYCTHSAQEKERVCRSMRERGLDFDLKLVNHTNPADRSLLGAALNRPELDVEYRFFVHKSDLAAATSAISASASDF